MNIPLNIERKTFIIGKRVGCNKYNLTYTHIYAREFINVHKMYRAHYMHMLMHVVHIHYTDTSTRSKSSSVVIH